MATRLQQVLTFTAVAPAGQQSLPHLINWDGRPVVPDWLISQDTNPAFTLISADTSQITIRNDTGVAADFVFWLHSLYAPTRAFGSQPATPAGEFLSPLPFVIGGGGGGGGGTSAFQAFRYTVTGLEPDPSDFFVPLPAVRANDVYRIASTLAGVAVIVAYDLPDLVPGDRTTVQFRIVTSAPLAVGDQIDFMVSDVVI